MSARRSPAAALPVLAAATCSAAVILGWGGYALIAWLGYGRLGIDRRRDPLLDRFIPVYEVGERHETRVAAPAELTYRIACDFDLRDSPLMRAIFRARELLLRAPATPETSSRLLVQTLRSGWRILAQEPGRELVVGTITRPWEPHVTFRAVEPDDFRAFDEPGYMKIVWTLCAEPIDDRTSIFRTVTRAHATDPRAAEKFRRYWAVFSPGIRLIRYEALRAVRAAARHDGRVTSSIASSKRPERGAPTPS